jgi:V/A-type H+-transporting ATPase subunit I
MAVEKMEMVNIVGHISDVDEVARKIILSSSVHMINSLGEIERISIKKSKEGEAPYSSFFGKYKTKKEIEEIGNKIDVISEILDIKKRINLWFLRAEKNTNPFEYDIDNIYEIIKKKYEEIKVLYNEIKEIEEHESYLSYMKGLNIDISELINMKQIKMKMGRLSSYDIDKLRKNYENIKAIVFKLHQDTEKAEVIVFIPEEVEQEEEKVLLSLNFNEFKLINMFEGTPDEWLKKLSKRKKELNLEINSIKAKFSILKKKYGKTVEMAYSALQMENKIESLKSNISCTSEFFYLTGWVPSVKKKELLRELEEYEDRLIVLFNEDKEVSKEVVPPTRLKNPKLLRPFESVVKLYGVPSYNEMDPTGFVGLSYMILFGAMFGDVGQGLVLYFLGILLNKKERRPNLGGIVSRLGLSSTVFGFLYGSIFGFEDILPIHIVRPIIDITIMLEAAILLGIVLVSVGYIYNIINHYKNKDIENGVFSGNGFVGLMFYWLLLYFGLAKVAGWKTSLPEEALIVTIVVLMILMIFKQPIANLIIGHRPLYHEPISDYYIESSFGIIEMLLSMFSNTVSFIRVGAFAINHVGLFIAFDTLAHMMSNGVESALMIVLGNVVIIGLEGLIVFIQGLRLEYYELFSKYFKGVGYEYSPYLLKGGYHMDDSRGRINKKFTVKSMKGN